MLRRNVYCVVYVLSMHDIIIVIEWYTRFTATETSIYHFQFLKPASFIKDTRIETRGNLFPC